MAIDTLYTSATYNAYTTVLEMDDIMANLGVLFNASFWTALDAPTKEALIKASTRYINTLDWLGDQNLDIVVPSMKWPRINLDGAEDTVVPYEIQLRAGCWIIHNATANGNGSGNKKAGSMKSKNVGEVSIQYETEADLIKATSLSATNPCEGYGQEFLAGNELSFGIGGVGLGRRP